MRPKQFRFPTLIGLLFLFLLATGGFYIADNFSSIVGRAGTAIVSGPKNVVVSNVTDTSFVISWTTELPIASFIRYGISEKNQTAYDVRDTDQIPKQRTHHYVELTGLEPDTSVEYEIVVATAAFSQDSVVVGPVLSTQPQVLPVYGTILTPDGSPTTGTIVYATVENSVLSRFIENGDGWVIPLSSLRTQDTQGYLCKTKACNDENPIVFSAIGNEGNAYMQTSIAEARPLAEPLALTFDSDTAPVISEREPIDDSSDTLELSENPEDSNDQPISPTAMITSNPSQIPSPTFSPTPTQIPSPTPVVLGTSTKQWDVTILTPKQGSISRYPQPLIRGEGVPGTEVEIIIESDVKQIGTVKVRTDGTWMWTPGLALNPGKHTVTVKTIDSNGADKILTRTFTIGKSGEQVLSSSTPSATLTPEISLSPTVTATPTSPVYPNTPTPTPPDMPVSASTVPTIAAAIGGVLLLILGLALL